MEKRLLPNENQNLLFALLIAFGPVLFDHYLTNLSSAKPIVINESGKLQGLPRRNFESPLATNEKTKYLPAISVEVNRGTQIDAFSIRNIGEVAVEDISTFELVFDHFQATIATTFDSKPVTGKIRALRSGESMQLRIPDETINAWLKSKSTAVHGVLKINLHAVGGKEVSTSYSFELKLYKCNQGHVHLKVSSLQRDPLMKLGDF